MNLLLSKLIAGFVIGAGAIIPGLSGGILAVSMGLYQPTIEAVTGFFKAPKKNFKFLFPLGVGGVIGLVVFMFLIDRTFSKFKTEVIALFLGLVIGSLPSFFKEANDGKPFKKSYIIFAVIGFAFAFSLVLFDVFTGEGSGGQARELTPFYAALAGAIIMMGIVLPGVSTSFILINLNIYESFINVFTKFFSDPWHNLVLALFAGLGILIVAVPMLFLVRKVLLKYHCQSFYFLFGVLVATLVGCVIQEVQRNIGGIEALRVIIIIALFVIGIIASYFMDKATQKLKLQAQEAASN